jgi:hypothetical protein
MKVSPISSVRFILFFCTVIFLSCVHWGYQGGPGYKKISSDNIRYICSNNEFRIKNAPETKASLYCYKENELLYRRIVVNKDTLLQEGFLKLPNDLMALTKNNTIKVEIIIDEKDYYDFIMAKESCVNDTISGLLRVY